MPNRQQHSTELLLRFRLLCSDSLSSTKSGSFDSHIFFLLPNWFLPHGSRNLDSKATWKKNMFNSNEIYSLQLEENFMSRKTFARKYGTKKVRADLLSRPCATFLWFEPGRKFPSPHKSGPLLLLWWLISNGSEHESTPVTNLAFLVMKSAEKTPVLWWRPTVVRLFAYGIGHRAGPDFPQSALTQRAAWSTRK